MFVEDGHSVMLAQSYAKNFGLSVPIQLILPTAPGVSNEGGSSPLLVPFAGCFLALGFGLRLVGTASASR